MHEYSPLFLLVLCMTFCIPCIGVDKLSKLIESIIQENLKDLKNCKIVDIRSYSYCIVLSLAAVANSDSVCYISSSLIFFVCF